MRALFSSIAADETRHAELSWQVAGWAEGRLSPAARRRIAAARSGAVQELKQRAATPPLSLSAASPLSLSAASPLSLSAASSQSATQQVGLPDPERSVALVSALERRLWQHA